jgi:uncharacterized protein (TIGR02646 family)
MIKVIRLPIPPILQRKAKEWRSRLLLAKTAKEHKFAESRYKHEQIKQTLITMFHGKCAYCESKIAHVDYGHIEHFKPKSAFPKWTFKWSNLFLACGICNGAEFKGNRFPGPKLGGPLVNPCDDEPNEHFRFEFDPRTGLASVDGISIRGELTEKLLGLNRRELRAYRSAQIRKIFYIANRAKTDAEAAALLDEAKKDDAAYAAFVRALQL